MLPMLSLTLVTIVIVLIVREYINLRFEKKLKHPIPIEIIAMILGTIISHFAQLHERFGLVITGDTPRGFIAPEVPVLIIHLENTIQFTTRTLFHLKYDFVFDCLGLAIAIYGVAIVLSKILAQRHRYVLDPNEELLAYGLGHLVSSFFHCFPVTQAPPRTLLMESQGAKTQLAGLTSALFVLAVIVAIGPLFYSMPRALLAAVTFTAVAPVLVRNTMDNRFYWATNKWDCLVWWATLISALLLDPFMAIAIGIGTNVLSMGLSSFFVTGSSFCHVKDTEIFVEHFAYHNVICSKDIRVFRFNGNLAFMNADSFRRQLFQYTVHPYRISRLRDKLAVNEQTPQQPSSNNYQENGVEENGAEENGIELGKAEEIENHVKYEHANTELKSP
jgi:MFS superfamily sulfate permease-like transporter